MKVAAVSLYIILLFTGCCHSTKTTKTGTIIYPIDIQGNFKDDYDIHYTIRGNEWVQHPNIKYHLLSYDSVGQFFIALNDTGNPSEGGLFSRIDIMHFTNMEPYRWGFCLTAYKAKTPEEAAAAASADRANPQKGCGGYPFSRMRSE